MMEQAYPDQKGKHPDFVVGRYLKFGEGSCMSGAKFNR